MKRRQTLWLSAALAACGLAIVGAASATGGYSIDRWTVAGGASSAGGSYTLSSSIGEPAAGAMNGGPYELAGGFWALPTAAGGNSPPTDIALSADRINEGQPIGTPVGTLFTTDPDPGDSFTYSLTPAGSTCPGTNNSAFHIDSNTLKSSAVFDYEVKKSYKICIETDDGHGGVLDKPFTISIDNISETTVKFRSMGSQDGWILESSEVSDAGGTLNSTSKTVNLGDTAARKQYRVVVSFDTSSLPDAAVVTKATLKLTRKSVTGSGNPFTLLQGMLIDAQSGFLGSNAGLELGDFEAPVGTDGLGPYKPKPTNGVYTITLPSAAYPQINTSTADGGVTQLRLRFKLDDNNNAAANYVSFYSGNAASTNRPQLIIIYYVP